jgi:hypothetical protein
VLRIKAVSYYPLLAFTFKKRHGADILMLRHDRLAVCKPPISQRISLLHRRRIVAVYVRDFPILAV